MNIKLNMDFQKLEFDYSTLKTNQDFCLKNFIRNEAIETVKQLEEFIFSQFQIELVSFPTGEQQIVIRCTGAFKPQEGFKHEKWSIV